MKLDGGGLGGGISREDLRRFKALNSSAAAGRGSEKRDGGENRDGDRSLLTFKDAATSIKMQGDLLGRDALPVA